MTAAPAAVVIWDVGGTLVVRHVSETDAAVRALRAAGLDPFMLRPEAIERSRLYRLDGLPRWRTADEEAAGFRTMTELLLEGLPAVREEQIATVTRLFAGYDAVYRPLPGMQDLLDELHGRGVRQAVVSNWPPSLRRFLDFHGLARFFEVVVASSEEGVLKPDPELLRRALQRLHVTAAQAVYIGDDVDLDVAPARALGMRAIHFSAQGASGTADAREAAELKRLLLPLLALTD